MHSSSVQLLTLIAGFEWRDHYACAPEGSDQWASTDRGWVHLANHPDHWVDELPETRRDYYSRCCGNYLRYQNSRGPNGETVHACAYVFRAAFPSGLERSIHLGARWCDTVTQAKQWVEDTVNAYLQTAGQE